MSVLSDEKSCIPKIFRMQLFCVMDMPYLLLPVCTYRFYFFVQLLSWFCTDCIIPVCPVVEQHKVPKEIIRATVVNRIIMIIDQPVAGIISVKGNRSWNVCAPYRVGVSGRTNRVCCRFTSETMAARSRGMKAMTRHMKSTTSRISIKAGTKAQKWD